MLRTYKQLTLRRILRHSMLIFAALTLTLTSFTPSAFAAAPQDTYTWQRNFGTSGCPASPPAPEYLNPSSIAFGNGKIYVSDFSNQIYMFDSNGNSLAKFGSSGSGDGQFGNPQDISIDASGNIWIADRTYQRIQKFDSNGNFLLKFGSAGAGNGQFSFGNNSTMAFDSVGNIWVVDRNNQRIQKFDSNGNYLSQFSVSAIGYPMGVAIDSAGNVRVVFSGSLYKFSPTGTMLTQYPITNGSSNGQLGDGGLYQIARLTLDASDNMYVTDARNSRIEKFDTNGNYLMKFGTNGASNGQFSSYGPLGISLDSAGNIWVSDDGSSGNVQKFDASGNFLVKITQFVTQAPPDDPSQLCYPTAITRDGSGKLYVADQIRNNIRIYNSDGTLARVFGSVGNGNGQLNTPKGIALDPSGNIYVADMGNHRIQKFDSNGSYLSQFGSTGSGNGQFSFIFSADIATDKSGNIYVVDNGNSRVQKFDNNGNYLSQFPVAATGAITTYPLALTLDDTGNIYVATVGVTAASTLVNEVIKYNSAGSPLMHFGSSGTGDGQFGTFIYGIAVDARGAAYVTDTVNNRVQKFDANGVYVGQFGTAGSSNGQFSSPAGVTLDPSGNAYVVDTNNSRISVWNAPIPPSAPQNLTQSQTSSATARLSWSSPAAVGSLSYTYTVQYRLKGASGWITAIVNLPSSTITYDLSGLTAGSAYDVQVLAVNSIGSSPVASLSFVMGGLADTGADMWIYAGVAISVIGGAIGILWRVRTPRRSRFLRYA